MKILSERVVRGKRRITVELEGDETSVLPLAAEGSWYRLPVTEELLPAHVLKDMQRVSFCWLEQEWRPA